MKKQSYLLTFAVASVLSAASNDLSAQMEETITYGSQTYYDSYYYGTWNDNWGNDYDRSYEPDEHYDDDSVLACNDLLMNKPTGCTTDPGSISNYVKSSENLINEELLLNGGTSTWFAYQGLFLPALLAAAESFLQNPDSYIATQAFLDTAVDICVNGAGADISAPTIWPVTNEVACVGVAGELADGMNPSYSWYDVGDIGVGFGTLLTFSFDLNFNPWGNKFFEGLTNFTQCKAWYSSYNWLQC